MKIILASNSPRRRQLLSLTQLDFEVLPADVDETPLLGESPINYVLRMALNKAQCVADEVDHDIMVIAADTTVVDRDQILGKPVDPEDAEKMLRQLRGRLHQVYTAITIIANGKTESECCRSDVPMRSYSDLEMKAYIDSGDPLDKAGAYAIQHPGFQPVVNFSGCFANVMGLPLCHLARALRKFDLETPPEIPDACQSTLTYDCPIYMKVLREEL